MPVISSRMGRGRRRALRLVTALTATGLLVPVLTAARMPPPSAAAQPNRLRPVPAAKPVPVHRVRSHPVRGPVMHAWHRPQVSWPAPGTATVALRAAGPARAAAPRLPAAAAVAEPSPGSARAGSLPVWTGPPVRSRADRHPSAPAAVTVAMRSRRLAAALGVSGVVFTLARADGKTSAAALHVSLDYHSFAFAAGGGYAGRLRLVLLPGCALSTPQKPSCRVQTPLSSANNVLRSELGADVTLPAAQAGPQLVLAATTSPSGSGGDYSATPLSEAGTWAAGGASGAFTYSYPIQVPPVPGGLAPDVSLGYNSQAVDGLTSSTNSQASWIGDGWDYQPGYIERDYQSCEQTSAKTGDLCWSSDDVTTLSLGGQTTTLVDDPSTGWHAEADNGDKIQYLTGASNGTNDGGYWVVTDPDGTSYYFGRNELPGYASGDAATNSAWTVPVYATSSSQPCYHSTPSKSHCLQAWRWNLDYVTDSHGDAEALFYKTETNYYAAHDGTTATASYIQGGALSKIEYGLRAGSVYGVTPAAQVSFGTVTTRTDIPNDLSCSSGASCDVISPTFWDKYQLTSISTESLDGGSLKNADSWALAQTFPATGDGTTDPPMWLHTITRTGEDGTNISLPPVTFAGTALPNRVETPADQQDGYSLYDRFRLTKVTSETGGVTQIAYDDPPSSCTSGNFPTADANTTVCYPDYWTPPDGSQVLDWFNKYVVTSVTESNTAGGTVPVITTYCYGAAPGCLSSGAWHYDDDALTRSQQRTWDEWRGFRTVTTETGTSPDPVTETKDTYFQGMDGDYQSGGGSTSASLTSSVGNVTVTDSDQYAGMDFEHTVYDGAGGGVVSDTVTTPWSSAATATQSQTSPLPPLKAYMTGTGETQVFTALAAGGYRESDTSYTHDSYGRITSVSDVPDTKDAAEDTCTTTSYAANASSWLLDLPAEVQVVSVPCGTTPVLPADAVSDTRHFYDGSSTLGAAPSAGNQTETQLATSYSGSTPLFTTQSKMSYDEYGRATAQTNADGNTTTTAYTPGTGAEPTSIAVTDPMGLVTTTTYDPVRDLPLTVTSPAGWVTTKQYDALGRLTAVWTPGHATSGPADATFSYDVSATTASVVTTNTVTSTGSYVPSETFYDSLGRQIETQTESPDSTSANPARDITDTYYNSDGWKILESNPYYATGEPSDTLVQAPDGQVPSQTGYFYDGAGRITRQVSYKSAAETWETDTSYGGDYTTVTPPAGGTPKTTYTDGRGLTSYIYQYHGSPPSSPPAPGSGSKSGSGGWDQTAYTYTPASQLASITDAAGNTWTYGYDLAGNKTSQTDPDSGGATMTYDPAGQLLTATDARGKTVSYTYDADGRKTAEYDTTGGASETGADELASWAYDTLAKGQPTSSTSYVGGTGGSSYTEAVTGYNPYGLPSGNELSVSSGPLAGTYKQSDYYTSYADLISSYDDYYPGDGIGTENGVATSYNSWGQPTGIASSVGDYVSQLSYTQLAQPQEYAFGTTNEPAWLYDTYDQETGQLTEALTQSGSSTGQPVTVDDQHYSYDNSGNITAEADTPPGGPAEVQCFQYDYLARLDQAWSQGSSGCASSPSQSAEGGAAPYWESYGYNDENNLTSETSTPPSGGATTTTNSFPAAGSSQPHAITGQQTQGPSGSTSTSYTYDKAGQLSSVSGAGGNQTLSWNDAGQLASDSTSAGNTGYVYDASGNLLLQSDPGSVTLYLPDEQIVYNTATGATSATRYYTIGGVTVATRTSGGTIDYLVGDQQGTDNLAIDAGSLAVTRRYYDPYGNPIGSAPASWPGTRGFVGGTTDQATGLTNLGAREYQPGTGSFISPDALLSPYEPQDLNAYAYASDNPTTESDPSGQMPVYQGTGGTCVGSAQYCEHVEDHQQGGGGGGAPSPAPICYYCYSGGYSGGRTDPTGYYGPVTAAYQPPIFEAPPITVVTRTPRVVAAHQASAGLPTCAGGVSSRFGGGDCRMAAPPPSSGGGWGFLGSLGHFIWQHRTGLMQIGLGAGAVGLTIVNGVQLGLDPGTDALEGADVGALADSLATEDAGAAADDGTPIYRGVAQGHNAFADAEQGIASPGDELGHADIYAHNAGDTWTSRLTSWLTDPEVAQGFAGKNGVILQTTIEDMQARGVNILASPDAFDEDEILLEGRIAGLQVMQP